MPPRSPRFTFRPLVEDDAGAVYELRAWIGAADEGELRARLRGWESRRSPDGSECWLNWLVLDGDDPVGWVQATIRGNSALIGYAVLPRRRREGVATEAVVAVTRWLHAEHPTVEAHIAGDNVASQAVARRADFVPTERVVGGETVWEHKAS